MVLEARVYACLSVCKGDVRPGDYIFLHPFLLHLLEFGVGGLGLRGIGAKVILIVIGALGNIPTLQFSTSLRSRTTVEHLRLVL